MGIRVGFILDLVVIYLERTRRPGQLEGALMLVERAQITWSLVLLRPPHAFLRREIFFRFLLELAITVPDIAGL